MTHPLPSRCPRCEQPIVWALNPSRNAVAFERDPQGTWTIYQNLDTGQTVAMRTVTAKDRYRRHAPRCGGKQVKDWPFH